MTDYEKRAFILASGQVLTEHLPENYEDIDWSNEDYEDIDEWVVKHAWEPYQYWDAKQLWEQIDSVAYTLKAFHNSEVDLLIDLVKAE